MPFFVYIILCNDGTYYTGYTKNVEKRSKLHSIGKGARYTKAHPPKEVVYVKMFCSRSEAMQHERAVKRLSHQQKHVLSALQKETKVS
jgi:putative endonuclease